MVLPAMDYSSIASSRRLMASVTDSLTPSTVEVRERLDDDARSQKVQQFGGEGRI